MITDGQLLSHVIEHTPIGIMIIDRETKITFVNQYVLDMFNAQKEDFIGKTIAELSVALKDIIDLDAAIKNVLDGTLSNFKVRIPQKDAPDLVCLYNSFTIDAVDPYPECVALVVRDITKEQASADLIAEKNIEMAKMNSELVRTNTELQKVSSLKSNFLSIASHELNTPLTSIKGYSDIIIDSMREKVDPSVYRMIESISRAADRLHKIVNNILDVTKIEQGRLKLRPEYIDLGAIIRDCCEEATQIAEKRGIVFNVGVENSLPKFYGDKMRMIQVFTNLFNNAIKYSPDGAAVNVAITLEDGEKFCISIADNGIGIDKSEQNSIFEPFYEVGSANRHSTDAVKFMGGGSGLGLSIARGIIERHGGRIWVESEGYVEGEFLGSVFYITLPQRSEISWDDDESKQTDGKLEDERSRMNIDNEDDDEHNKPLILFIDPDKESTDLASQTIENIFDILVADSGEQGLFIAFSHRPSLILIESKLPGLDGYKICKILRTQNETKNTPIAFFSAGAEDENLHKCFACGADDFVVKPFTGRELVEKICRLLMKKKEDAVFK